MADLKRKKGESFEAFLRRFKSSLKNNKRLDSFKKKRTYSKEKTSVQLKKSALARLELGKKFEYLRKTGKLKDTR
ncbi:MAG: 30S ribosomal protein S21 [Patescibacteria group bacterium]|nr:30S ribosomal protein S21 [Patescibacteria group bacterium]